jgi:hypothetical protein
MSTLVLVCGNVFDGLSDALTGPAEILIEGNRITKIERSVGRPPGNPTSSDERRSGDSLDQTLGPRAPIRATAAQR